MMIFSNKTTFCFISFLFCVCITIAQPSIQGYQQTDIKDLVLIYQGGIQRMDWTKEQFLPYVIHQYSDGRKNWLFDGFLFLEFKDGKGRCYTSGYEKENARKQEWLWLLNRLFEKGKSLSALNNCIEEQKKELGQPPFRHRIVIGLPEPILNQKDWGTLKGKQLDFSFESDRYKACKWYIDELKKRFTEAKLNNLELAGYYWVAEDMINSKKLTVPIGNYIRSLGQKFYWIPYWNAMGYSEWKNLGFDIAYAQPNHFFQENIKDDRINKTCQLAYTYHLGLEVEFDERALADKINSYRSRLISYLDRFEQEDVFNESAIAYYEGGGAIFNFSKSKNPLDHQLMDRLSALINQRHTKRQQKKFENKEFGFGRIDVKVNIHPTNNSHVCIKLCTEKGYVPGIIKMMEYNSDTPDLIRGGVETETFNSKSIDQRETSLTVYNLCSGNHTFSCERTIENIKLYVDNVLFYAMDNDYGKNTKEWPFIGPLRLIIETTSPEKSLIVEVKSIQKNEIYR